MKINVLAYDVFIWTNQIRVNGESARASFDWLQEEGPALPSRLQNSVSERIVPKLQAQIKERRSCTYRIIFGKCLLYIHKSFRKLTQFVFFTHTDWFYAVNPFCSSLNCCFRLQITVHRLAVLLTVFWRKKPAKSVSAEKWKAEEYRSHLFCVSMKLQFHNTWITLAKKVKCCKSFFLALESRFAPLQIVSCACKFNLRLQSYVHLHNSYPSHANLLANNLPSYHSHRVFCVLRFVISNVDARQAHTLHTSAPLYGSGLWQGFVSSSR